MKRHLFSFILVVAFLITVPVAAQQQPTRLSIVRADVSRQSSIELTVSALDDQGKPLSLTNEFISIKHNGEIVDNAKVVRSQAVGTYTMFLLDLPSGVAGEIDAMRASIGEFASDGFMQEQSDYVSIHRVDAIGAIEVQKPTFFYNEIANLFTLGITTHDGPTALIDSAGDLLTRVDALRPDSNLPTSLVIFSDGTDTVSNQFTADQIKGLARDKGIRIYTVVVDNANLINSTEIGREFMETLAAETGGGSVLLPDITGSKILWSDIVSYRDMPVVSYIPTNMTSGAADVELTLPNYPGLQPATSSVTVPGTLPSLTIDIPEDARNLSISQFTEPVSLKFPTTLRWLDEEVRSVQKAQLWLDGRVVSELEDPSQINPVTADLLLQPGENVVQVVIIDDAGQTAQSAPLVLNVAEGEDSIPRALQAGTAIPWRIIGYVLICLLIIGLLIYFFRLLRKGAFTGGKRSIGKRVAGRSKNRPKSTQSTNTPDAAISSPRQSIGSVTPPAYTPPADQAATQVAGANGMPTIEVIEARSSVSTLVPVNRSEFLIGRSPTVDLALTEDSTVSRIHATIVQDGGIYRIYDEQSTSGTYVNDREVPEYGLQLSNGDEIHIGSVHLRFRD